MPVDPAVDSAAKAAQQYWSEVESMPVLPEWSVDEVREYLNRELPVGPGRSAVDVVATLVEGLSRGTLHLQHPCYYGLFNPGVTSVTVAADLLVAAFNPQLAAWSHGGLASEADAHVLKFFASVLGFPRDSAAFFTSGGQEANQSALLCALADRLPGYSDEGLTGRPTVYLSAEAHHSFHKSAKACGMGTKAVREIPVDENLCMIPAALEQKIADDVSSGYSPVMAVATVGTTGAGAIDPIVEVTEVCRRHGLWVHADAAWAAAVCLSPTHRELCTGIEAVDSVTWDAHKWLQVPMGAGMFFCRNPESTRLAFGIGTSYMPASVPGAVDGYDTSPQWSRRSIGLKVLAQVATMGVSGLAKLVDDMTDMGDVIRTKVLAAGWTVVNHTKLPLVCFTHTDIECGAASIDDVLTNLYARGHVWVSIYRSSDGRRSLRACVTNALTQEKHIDKLVVELGIALEQAKFSNR